MPPKYQIIEKLSENGLFYNLSTVKSLKNRSRGVAQPGSVPEWGSGGRRFKSSRPDHFIH